MRNTRRTLIRAGLKRILALTALLSVITAGVCWAIGWRSLGQYAMALILGGLLLALLGMGSIGSTEHLKDPRFLIARSVSSQTPQERFRADLDAVRESVDMSAPLGLVSLSLISLGGLLLALA